jgi:hypothetical protein
VVWGRLAGALIIFGGLALSGWMAADYGQQFFEDDNVRVQLFLERGLNFLYIGITVILVAEIASRLRGVFFAEPSQPEPVTEAEAEPDDQQEPTENEDVSVRGAIRESLDHRTLENWDFAWLGRRAGLALILGGIVFGAWQALFLHDNQGAEDRWDLFLSTGLGWLFSGGLLVLLAEIASRLWPGTGARDGDWDEPAPVESSVVESIDPS